MKCFSVSGYSCKGLICLLDEGDVITCLLQGTNGRLVWGFFRELPCAGVSDHTVLGCVVGTAWRCGHLTLSAIDGSGLPRHCEEEH